MWGRRRASDRSEASKEGHKQNLRRRSCGVKALGAFLWEGGGGKVGKRGESWSAARRPVSCTQITFIVAHSCTQIRWTLQCKACTRLHIDPFHIHHKLQTVARHGVLIVLMTTHFVSVGLKFALDDVGKY